MTFLIDSAIDMGEEEDFLDRDKSHIATTSSYLPYFVHISSSNCYRLPIHTAIIVRIHQLAVVHAILVSVALGDKPLDYKSYFLPLSSEKLVTFNTSAILKSVNVPAITSSTITKEECLDPLDRPYYEDCSSICGQSPNEQPEGILVEFQGPVEIQPLEIWLLEYSDCVFRIANLDPCEIIDIDPLSDVWAYCYSMYANCAFEGYDGYLEGTDPEMAMALSGTPGAPPYVEDPCV
ncbi:hypothetical protein DL95DRAFT_458586 [Leptodontidium sp. 2 PMI_412]|nr:hypothetical protein DL95DRAFT_458586 [Leptodontidium sp. 2 PMI_412]